MKQLVYVGPSNILSTLKILNVNTVLHNVSLLFICLFVYLSCVYLYGIFRYVNLFMYHLLHIISWIHPNHTWYNPDHALSAISCISCISVVCHPFHYFLCQYSLVTYPAIRGIRRSLFLFSWQVVLWLINSRLCPEFCSNLGANSLPSFLTHPLAVS